MVSRWITLTNSVKRSYSRHKFAYGISTAMLLLAFAFIKPQQFANLWLTPDQQGRLMFQLGRYELGASLFTNIRWRAYSLYGAEQFDQAALVYGQFELPADQLGRANAYAHARRYVKAADAYRLILQQHPTDDAARNNLDIVQKIIDDVNRMSASQKAEEGDSSQELGDAPQTGDGAEKEFARKRVLQQLTAEQILLDPSLNAMWLRQVQKPPKRFLTSKFSLQLARQRRQANVSGALNE